MTRMTGCSLLLSCLEDMAKKRKKNIIEFLESQENFLHCSSVKFLRISENIPSSHPVPKINSNKYIINIRSPSGH